MHSEKLSPHCSKTLCCLIASCHPKQKKTSEGEGLLASILHSCERARFFVELSHRTLRGLIKLMGGRGCSRNQCKFLQVLSASPTLTLTVELIIVLANFKHSPMTHVYKLEEVVVGLSHAQQIYSK